MFCLEETVTPGAKAAFLRVSFPKPLREPSRENFLWDPPSR